MRFLNARKGTYHTNPKMIDEAIYTPYFFRPNDSSEDHHQARPSHHAKTRGSTGDLLGIPELQHEEEDLNVPHTSRKKSKFDTADSEEGEIFLFEYGTVVFWSMTEPQERRFLSSLKRFEVEKLASEEVQMEDLNFYYANYSR